MAMAKEIKLPMLAEHLDTAKILEVKVTPGTEVSKGQALVEVDVEKATLDVPAPEAGKISEVLVKNGDEVSVGQALFRLEPAGGNGRTKGAAPAAAEKKRTAPAKAEAAAPAAEEEGKKKAKTAEEVEETAEKKKEQALAKTKKEAPAKRPEETIAESKEEVPAEAKKEKENDGARRLPPSHRDGERERADPVSKEQIVPAGPATRRLARDLGVDLHHVAGSGPHGRIVPDDVKAFVRQLGAKPAKDCTGIQVPPLPDFEHWGSVERKPLDQVRSKTAEHVSLAWRQIPHVTHHDQCDITDLDAFRREQEGHGPKLTITAFALKAVAIALQEFPRFNSSLDMANGQLILKKYIHIGIAVDTERGLLVPVLRDVDQKSIAVLARELADLADRARQKKLSPDDMRGGTFTITNVGGIGGIAFTPIINYPEVAILGLSRAHLQPVIRDGQVVPRLILTLSLSYDHRVIDGADAARFTRRICEMLEQPLRMLLQA
jgi:pyruvate dehydrogenase E2 component (dihydrolipoamide acetyltransferase)